MGYWDEEKQKLLNAHLRKQHEPAMMAKGGTAGVDGYLGLANSPAEDGLPPVPPSDLSETEEDREAKIEDSDPGLQPDDLTKYVREQQAQSSKYGPEDQKNVLESLEKEQHSIPNIIGRASTGFADAIMQGVAGAGNPGFQKQFDDNLASRQKLRADAIPSLQKMNLEQMGERRKLEGMTSESPLGRSYIDSLEPLAKILYPKLTSDQWAKISSNPAALQSMIGPSVDMKKVEGELATKEAMLMAQNDNYRKQRQIEEEKLRLEREKTSGEERKKATDTRTGILRDKAKSWNPIVSIPANLKLSKIEKELEKGATEQSEGPYGAETVKDGKTYVWSPSTGKYHLKK